MFKNESLSQNANFVVMIIHTFVNDIFNLIKT